MPTYKCNVVEVVQVEMEYIVEADSVEEARIKCEKGDTTESEEIKIIGVVHREPVDDPVLAESEGGK